MDVSITSINAGKITAMAMSHGLTPGGRFSAEVSLALAMHQTEFGPLHGVQFIRYNPQGPSFADLLRHELFDESQLLQVFLRQRLIELRLPECLLHVPIDERDPKWWIYESEDLA